MGKFTRTASLLFLAAASVYSDRATVATVAAVESPARGQGNNPATEVKLLSDAASDPFAAPAPLATDQTAARPAESQGHSVTTSEVNVNAAGTVEIHVNDASLVEVLRMLSMQSQKNIVATRDVNGTVTANLYNVTVREALDAILTANGYAYREKGNFIYVYTQKQLAEIEKSERKMTTEVFTLHYTRPSDVTKLLLPVLSKDSQIAQTPEAISGIASGAGEAGGNNHSGNDVIVINDYPENLAAAKKIIQEVDRRPQQVLIEATLMTATLTEDNAFGIDFNIVGGVDFSTLTSASGQITNANLPSADTAGTGTGTGAAATGGDAALGNTRYSTGTGNSFTNGINGFRAGVVTDNLSVFLAALEGVTDTTVLANPKVLVLNKQKGEVHIGAEDGYRGTTTQTETAATESVQFLSTGVRLIFRPYIGDDGYIRMEVHPEDSSGSVDKTTGLPSKTTTDVTSNIMVKDGHTIVIGGLFREVNRTDRSQIPILGDIPVLGYLFRKQADSTVRQEVIILLTPHIVKEDSVYAEASEQVLKDMQQLRVGVRKGMMPWGRERLAECWYEKAVAEMRKPSPNRKKAIWYLGCATDLNPKFLEAIHLKQSLTGHEVTAVDNSSIRDFVQRQILLDQARATKPLAPAPANLEPPTFAPAPRPATRPAAMQPAATRPAATRPAARAPLPPATQAAQAHPTTRPDVPATASRLDLVPPTLPVTPIAQGGDAPPLQAASATRPTTAPVAAAGLHWLWNLFADLPRLSVNPPNPSVSPAATDLPHVTVTELPLEETAIPGK
jgi:type IV pilus assembly protein PilQ